jgi:hypothetical protein
MRARPVSLVLVVLGAVVVAGHLVALGVAGMTLSSWLTGTVLGLLLAVVGGAHLLIGTAAGDASTRGRQLAFGVVALVLGVAEGLAGIALRQQGWRLLLPWAVTALAIGMLMAGPPREKALRLSTFGFSSVLIVAAGTRGASDLTDVVVMLLAGLAGAAGAVGVGAVAHTVVSRAHPAAPVEG